mmetsp:Transcript_125957/g.299010  ORF Transcript_125957/g.299010 Transcript_125957/m.299010 type:complete len:203 (-) Transcript_125957:33-641(-)
MVPSLPTFSNASATILPITSSPFAEMVATCAISLGEEMSVARFSKSSRTILTEESIPRLTSIGFIPATTAFVPSRKIARASTVDVVVPSPARSFVFEATCLINEAPTFTSLFLNSIALATVTPSLVTFGAPKLCSMTTLRPLGPSVTATASASRLAPWSMAALALVPCLMSLEANPRTPRRAATDKPETRIVELQAGQLAAK